MAKLSTNEIREMARKIIANNTGGIHYQDLHEQISTPNPETPKNTITGTLFDLTQRFPQEISKPSRGLFVPVGPSPPNSRATDKPPEVNPKYKEEDFYAPFADWLKNDLDEVTESAALGGASIRNKWGTPDVVGVYKPLASNLIKFAKEIVSAEIKIDPRESVVAFGQAIAYRLFSTKTYIAMPSIMSLEDQSRLDSLCMLFGVGFVRFELKPDKPNFQIRVRAQKFTPDMFYVNEFAERLKESDADKFEELFRG
jgi:preprotein translocase subunit Sec61beta